MILSNKIAIVYGAYGSLGSTVAIAFAAAGAKVYLTGRNLVKLQAVADRISKNGGNAEVAIIDALDELAVANKFSEILNKEGKVDISFNAIGSDIKMNVLLVTMSVEEYVAPITSTMQTRFITACVAGRAMMRQGSGVILTLTATPGGIGYPYTGGFAAACAAIENFSRNLAIELGIYGVRVVNIRSGGSPDSAVFKNAIENDPGVMKGVIKAMENDTMLKKLPSMNDIANTAVFLASELAGNITGVTIDVTGGTTAGLNYRVENSL